MGVVTPPDPVLWAVIVAMGVGTFAFRFSFLGLSDRLDEVPPLAERALSFVPAAVLAALVLPALLVVDGSVAVAGNDRLLAGAFGAAVAWRTEDIFWTIVAGVGALLVLQALL